MMAFFMHYYKKINKFLCFFLLVICAQSAIASGTSMHIRSAELVAVDGNYELNADVDMKFSPKVEEAISKGFVLNYIVEFQLSKPKKYWFDDEIMTVSEEVSLNYHALSRQYLVTRGDQQRAFVRLDEALDDLSDINAFKVLKQSMIEKEDLYKAVLLMRLDTKKLPQALQADEEWHMKSQRLEWWPNFANNQTKTEVKSDNKLELVK
jgi:hypothetical protein